jgi:hypothetical protein
MMEKKGENWSRKFTKSGTYRYHCHPHEAVGMKAVVIVDRESRPNEFRKAMAGEHAHPKGMDHGDSQGGKQMSEHHGGKKAGHHDGGSKKAPHGKPGHGH